MSCSDDRILCSGSIKIQEIKLMTKLNNKSDSTVSKDGLDKVTAGQRPFSKINFWMMGGCLALIIIGFLLMSGGGTNGTDFNPEVFSTRRIVVAQNKGVKPFHSLYFVKSLKSLNSL